MSAVSEADWLADAQPARVAGGRPAKGHVGRQRKIHCERCQVILYGSRAALQRSGMPVCGCGERMVIANYRDRAKIEPDDLEAELVGYGRDAYNAVARELGWPRWAATPKPTRGGAGQKRCAWAEGYCSRFTATLYCGEHTPGDVGHYSDRRGA